MSGTAPSDGHGQQGSELPAFELQGINASYGTAPVLWDVSIRVLPSNVTAILGANGAGKTTTLKVASGLMRPKAGAVSLGGKDVTRLSAHERAKSGVCLIPEGRGIFRTLSVRENLELQVPPGSVTGIEPAIAAFPVLGTRLKQVAGSMSGGQQQMLALSRAFLSSPSVVLLDELSMGLAPILIDELFVSFHELARNGVSLIIVEQYVSRALELADSVYLMAGGRVVWTGPASELNEDELASTYLGERVEEISLDSDPL